MNDMSFFFIQPRQYEYAENIEQTVRSFIMYYSFSIIWYGIVILSINYTRQKRVAFNNEYHEKLLYL